MISIIIPTKNESATIHRTLSQFEKVSDIPFEVIVSDASSDRTAEIVKAYAAKATFPLRFILSPSGRACQMNEGACAAKGDILLFLHADTILPNFSLNYVQHKIGQNRWGGFCHQFDDLDSSRSSSLLKFIAWRSNFRLRFFKIVYGDQALFVEKKLFEEIGGFGDMPMLEDLEISKRLRKRAKMACISEPVVTSSRRFLDKGILKVYIKMFMVVVFYKLGVDIHKIKKFYE